MAPSISVLGAAREDLPKQADTTAGRNIRKPNDPCVSSATSIDQRAKIRVYRDQDALFRDGNAQQRCVAGIVRFHPPGVVTLCSQPFGQPAPGAPVDEKSHRDDALTASIESLATTAWA
jgi:hypothetical protein